MPDDRTQAAVKATAQMISDDDAYAIAAGLNVIPSDEVIVQPNPVEYFAPHYLQKTAPQLAPEFGKLLGLLRDLNARFVGERTVEVQAALSLTGEHEWLEEEFLEWCQKYFKIRGSLDRLNPRNENDPRRLYWECITEFKRLVVERIVQPGTINSSVLNLSQRFMDSGFASQVMEPDLREYAATGRDRYSDVASRNIAQYVVGRYSHAVEAFDTFLQRIAQNLTAEYAPKDDPEWMTGVQTKVARCAEDLNNVIRNVLCVLNVSDTEKRQLTHDLWARFRWEVYHGGSVAAVLTSSSPAQSIERFTLHDLAFLRNGWLCHREYPWLRVQPDDLSDERHIKLAVSWYILDTLTSPLYEAWVRIDTGSVVRRGLEADATEEQQTAALALAFIESDTDEAETPIAFGFVRSDSTEAEVPIAKRPRLPQLRLKRIQTILKNRFDCEWSPAKGSEQKVFRHGGKHFTFGRHGIDRAINPVHLKECLKKLGIPVADFLTACH